jgi:hypothetical protein
MSSHPMQPIDVDAHGVTRFKRNQAVCYLLDHGCLDLNDLVHEMARGAFPVSDYMQLMQLIGYSTSGYGDLAYGDDDCVEWEASAEEADRIGAQVYEEWKTANS